MYAAGHRQGSLHAPGLSRFPDENLGTTQKSGSRNKTEVTMPQDLTVKREEDGVLQDANANLS